MSSFWIALQKLPWAFILGIALWAASDILFSLEYSWFLFLYRVLAPITCLFAIIAFSIQYAATRLGRARLSLGRRSFWIVVLCVASAPIIRSIPFIPTYTVRAPADSPTLTVLNLNALGFRDLSSRIIDEIERRDPDIITIQEVNPDLARALEDRFALRYSCRVLRPAVGSWGMGTLARAPCTQRTMPEVGSWVGLPIIIETTAPTGSPIIVANFHAIHPHAGVYDGGPILGENTGLTLWAKLSQPIFDRQKSVGFLLDTIGTPRNRNVIMTGDLNASMRNGVYATVRKAGYYDTWLDLHSFVSGGTWPAPEFLGGFGLGWLLRIDFMFRSESLIPTQVELLPETLGSDHRGMFGRFAVMR